MTRPLDLTKRAIARAISDHDRERERHAAMITRLIREALIAVEPYQRKRIARGTEQPISTFTLDERAWFTRSVQS